MLNETLTKYQIILGSKSPRRQQFLKDLNIPFQSRAIDTDEIYPHHLKAEQITEFLAEYKSNAINLSDNELLITADTIVWLNDRALEKPANRKEAVNMLKELSDSNHEVITSICLATTNNTKVITDKTKVCFNKLSLNEIEFYIDTYQPFDKAGGYGIQEWIGLIGVKKIEGSYANVVGLPVYKLYNELKNF
ncbi:Maf family nucleotide pyrophosphatase [Wenyingzhuangia sp. IMCC45533]